MRPQWMTGSFEETASLSTLQLHTGKILTGTASPDFESSHRPQSYAPMLVQQAQQAA